MKMDKSLVQNNSASVAQDESESLDMLCATASWLRSNFKDHLMKAGVLSIRNTHTHTHTDAHSMVDWLIGSMKWMKLMKLIDSWFTGWIAFRCAPIWMVSILEPRVEWIGSDKLSWLKLQIIRNPFGRSASLTQWLETFAVSWCCAPDSVVFSSKISGT